MLVSHEVPICLLEESHNFNDYDYCLLHLTYTHKKYKDYYINAINHGRKVLLDNSLFELGDSLNNDEFAKGILELNPTWYVVPDCLNNKNETINRFKDFKKRYNYLKGIDIGVVQGSSLKDLVDCYKFMSKNASKIAIPFDSLGFNDLFSEYELESYPTLVKWQKGRQRFIHYLYSNNIWNDKKPHHLLGCSLAKEFSYILYKLLYIETIDTSNPIIAGIKLTRYEKDGLKFKYNDRLCDLVDYKVNSSQKLMIYYNVFTFKNILNDISEE